MQEKIWEFETARFRVVVGWDWEDSPDLSWDETGETREKLESGEWGNYCFVAKVYCDGRELAADYLGNSIYAEPGEFRDHIGLAAKSRADGCNYGSYFKDMVDNVITEARKAICDVPRVRCPKT
jgi:hypothetical protein